MKGIYKDTQAHTHTHKLHTYIYEITDLVLSQMHREVSKEWQRQKKKNLKSQGGLPAGGGTEPNQFIEWNSPNKWGPIWPAFKDLQSISTHGSLPYPYNKHSGCVSVFTLAWIGFYFMQLERVLESTLTLSFNAWEGQRVHEGTGSPKRGSVPFDFNVLSTSSLRGQHQKYFLN